MVGAVAAFRNQPLKAYLAGRAEEIRPDLAALEPIDENPLQPACQQPFEVGLAHRQRQLAQIVTASGQDVESAELDLVVMLAGVQGIEVRNAFHAERPRHQARTASDGSCAASTIHG